MQARKGKAREMKVRERKAGERKAGERETREGKSDEIKPRGKKRGFHKAALIYGAAFLASALLIGGAFFAPWLVFGFQDNIRCGKVVLGELESMDIASFYTGYETDLYRRLARFAEGLSRGSTYYVADQEMEPTSDFVLFLNSERGLFQDQLLIWIDEGVLPEAVLSYNLKKWKQYVIYGDDFSAGVNFILWYIELANPDTPVLKLLMDGETGDIYGISIRQTADTLAEGESIETMLPETWIELVDGRDDWVMGHLWCVMAVGYGGVLDEETYGKLEEYGYYFSDVAFHEETNEAVYGALEADYDALEADFPAANSAYADRDVLDALEMIKWEISEDATTQNYFFPYEEDGDGARYELLFSCRMDQMMLVVDERKNERKKFCMRPVDFRLGFPNIYELIPEFMESP